MKTPAQALADKLIEQCPEVKGVLVVTIVDTPNDRQAQFSVRNIPSPYLVLIGDELIKRANILGIE